MVNQTQLKAKIHNASVASVGILKKCAERRCRNQKLLCILKKLRKAERARSPPSALPQLRAEAVVATPPATQGSDTNTINSVSHAMNILHGTSCVTAISGMVTLMEGLRKAPIIQEKISTSSSIKLTKTLLSQLSTAVGSLIPSSLLTLPPYTKALSPQMLLAALGIALRPGDFLGEFGGDAPLLDKGFQDPWGPKNGPRPQPPSPYRAPLVQVSQNLFSGLLLVTALGIPPSPLIPLYVRTSPPPQYESPIISPAPSSLHHCPFVSSRMCSVGNEEEAHYLSAILHLFGVHFPAFSAAFALWKRDDASRLTGSLEQPFRLLTLRVKALTEEAGEQTEDEGLVQLLEATKAQLADILQKVACVLGGREASEKWRKRVLQSGALPPLPPKNNSSTTSSVNSSSSVGAAAPPAPPSPRPAAAEPALSPPPLQPLTFS